MKKTVILVVLVVMALPGISGAVLGKASIGPKIAFNVADIRGRDVPLDSDSRITASIGAYIEYPITSMISVQAELLYATRGFKEEGTFPQGDIDIIYDYTFSFSYIEIPLLVRVNIPAGMRLKPYAIVGPAVSFNTRAKLELEYMRMIAFEEGLKDDTKDIDYGLVVGGGLELPVRSIKIFVGGRYELGLTSFLETAEAEVDIKHQTISIVAGVGF